MGVFIDDISSGQEFINISFVNDIDDETISSDVEYTPINVPGSGSSEINFETVPQPCSCSDECFEDFCSCASLYGFSYMNKTLLEECFSESSKLAIECSCLCRCSYACANRVVQHGIQYKLQVFKTGKKGFGVRTLVTIPRLTFVCEYAGEVIGIEEARTRTANDKDDQPNYIFVLKEHSEMGVTRTVVDPTHVGNVGRYINHSCSPNLLVAPVRIDNMIPKICFFAARDIPPLEELCYDYGNRICGDDSRSLLPEDEPCSTYSMKRCLCDSSLCAGFLPCDPNVFS